MLRQVSRARALLTRLRILGVARALPARVGRGSSSGAFTMGSSIRGGVTGDGGGDSSRSRTCTANTTAAATAVHAAILLIELARMTTVYAAVLPEPAGW